MLQFLSLVLLIIFEVAKCTPIVIDGQKVVDQVSTMAHACLNLHLPCNSNSLTCNSVVDKACDLFWPPESSRHSDSIHSQWHDCQKVGAILPWSQMANIDNSAHRGRNQLNPLTCQNQYMTDYLSLTAMWRISWLQLALPSGEALGVALPAQKTHDGSLLNHKIYLLCKFSLGRMPWGTSLAVF